ncbi:hypothetical protein N7523_008683 [Penicillium sp. IBT 18751x]|nr:hypothetical protein N7523_008683 [Penicillium sp. IBT 18751x]
MMPIISTAGDTGGKMSRDLPVQETIAARAERVLKRAESETLPINFTTKEMCLLIQHFKTIKVTDKANINIRNLLATIIINRKYPDEVGKMFEDIEDRKSKGYAARWTNEFHMADLEREVLQQLEVEEVNGEQGPPWVVPKVPADPSEQRGRFADNLRGGSRCFFLE